jgi:hypothetical protein
MAIVASSMIAAMSTALSMALAPKAPGAPPPQMAIRQPVPMGRVIYGRARVGGDLALYHRGELGPLYSSISDPGGDGSQNVLVRADGRKNLNVIIVLAVHEIEGVVSIHDGENLFWSAADGIAPAYSAKVGNVIIRRGGDDQTAIAGLVAALPETLAGAAGVNFRLRGAAYVWVELVDVRNNWGGGMPMLWAEIDGALIYDPRSDARAFSANAALCMADYLTRDRGGVGLAWSDIDQEALSVAANICDETVTIAAGGTIARYEINGVIMSDAVPRDVLNSLSIQCAGQVCERGGLFVIQAGAYVSPVAAIGPGDMMGALKVTRAVNIEALPNGVGGTYTSAPAGYVPDGLPVTIFSDYDDENGVARILDLNFERETHAERAQRCAVIAARRARRAVGVSVEVAPRFATLEAGDVVTLDLPSAGIASAVFEVIEAQWIHTPGRAVVALSLIETSAAVFGWSTSDAGGVVTAAPSGAPSSATVEPVSGVTLTAQTRIASDGAAVPVLLLEWTASPDFWLARYMIRWTPAGGVQRIAYAPADASAFEILGAVEGVAVSATVEAVNIFDRTSAGDAPSDPVAPVIDATPPDPPGSLVAAGSVDKIVLSWVSPTDADLAAVIVLAGASDVLADAVEIWRGLAASYEAPSAGVGVARWFWLRAVDRTGNLSTVAGPVTAAALGVVAADIADDAIETAAINQVAVSNGVFAFAAQMGVTRTYVLAEALEITATGDEFLIEGAFEPAGISGSWNSTDDYSVINVYARLTLKDTNDNITIETTFCSILTATRVRTTDPNTISFGADRFASRIYVGAHGLEVVAGHTYRLEVHIAFTGGGGVSNNTITLADESRVFLRGLKR